MTGDAIPQIFVAGCLLLATPRLLRGDTHWWLLAGPLATSLFAEGPFGGRTTAFVVLAALAIGFLAIGRRKDPPLRVSVVGLLFIAYMTAVTLIMPGGTVPLAIYLASSGLFLAVGTASRPLPTRDTLFHVVTAIVALDVLSSTLRGVPLATSSTAVQRSFGFFSTAGGPNLAGVFCAIAFALNLALLAGVARGKSRVMPAISAGICAAAVLATLSRRALLAAAIVVVIAFIARATTRRNLVTGSLLIISLGLFYGSIVSPALANLELRFSRTGEDREYRQGEIAFFREGTWSEKLWGGGIENGRIAFPGPDGGVVSLPVHNSFLFVALAFGLLGATWLTLYVGAVVYGGFRHRIHERDGRGYASVMVLVVIVVAGLFGEMFILGSFASAFWVAIGTLASRPLEKVVGP